MEHSSIEEDYAQQQALNCLKLTYFRNFKVANFWFQPGFNIVVGENGTGKTSILEAIGYLGLGKSFRSSKAAQIAHNSSNEWVVYSESKDLQLNLTTKLAWKWSKEEGNYCQINQEKQLRIADFLKQTPVQSINHENYYLIESGPQFKREFIHWLAFHTIPEFYPAWSRYQQIIKQRNAALKGKKWYQVWDDALAIEGEIINRCCMKIAPILTSYAQKLWKKFGCFGDLSLEYKQGWPADVSLAEALAASVESDLLHGNTSCGPHRADLKIQIDGMPVKHWLSRGQSKLLFIILYLAREQYLQIETEKQSIILVDDLSAELSPNSRSTIINAIQSMNPGQVFITTQLIEQLAPAMENINTYNVVEL